MVTKGRKGSAWAFAYDDGVWLREGRRGLAPERVLLGSRFRDSVERAREGSSFPGIERTRNSLGAFAPERAGPFDVTTEGLTCPESNPLSESRSPQTCISTWYINYLNVFLNQRLHTDSVEEANFQWAWATGKVAGRAVAQP